MLQIKKPRQEEIKYLAQSHTANEDGAGIWTWSQIPEPMSCSLSLNPPGNPVNEYHCYPHLIEEKTETWSSCVTFPPVHLRAPSNETVFNMPLLILTTTMKDRRVKTETQMLNHLF